MPTVKSIYVYSIEDRLRKSNVKEDKDTWQYIKKLKEAYERQGELTKKAMRKIYKQAVEIKELNEYIDGHNNNSY